MSTEAVSKESLLTPEEKDNLIALLIGGIDFFVSVTCKNITLREYLDTKRLDELKYLLGKHGQIKLLKERKTE